MMQKNRKDKKLTNLREISTTTKKFPFFSFQDLSNKNMTIFSTSVTPSLTCGILCSKILVLKSIYLLRTVEMYFNS